MNKLSGITGNELSDEWYTSPDTVKLMVKILKPRVHSVICCPFDTQKSHFVKVLQELGHTVIHSINDWLTQDYEYDYLITNPPFSIKDQVIEKCLISGKPSVLILPIDSMGGVKRHELYKTYGWPTIYMPTRRINYISEDEKQTKGNHFHSIVMKLNDHEQKGLIWESQHAF